VALGGRLYSDKKNGLDAGVIFRRQSDIKKINLGAGVSARFWMFHLGASVYRDDMFIDLTKYTDSMTGISYSTFFGKDSLKENFLVTTYTAGIRIKNLALDVGNIKSTLKFYDEKPTEIKLYSVVYHYGNFLF
jgi:hypothetical protein